MPSLKICVCGSGEGAHCLVGLASSQPDVEVKVLALHDEDAKTWKRELRRNDFVVVMNERNGNKREIKANPSVISKDPSDVVSGSDFILIAVPPTFHADYMKEIKSYIGKNALIVGLPGGPGFEYQCRDILGEKSIPCSLMNFNDLPWNSKIVEFGKKVEILNFRSSLLGSMIRGRGICKRPPLMTLQMIHGAEPLFRQAKNCLESTLMAQSYVRPAIIYGEWSRWNGKPVNEAPLFYEGITKETAEMISHCSDECVNIAGAIMKKSTKKLDLSGVVNILDWYKEFCSRDVENCRNLMTVISTNKIYQGFRHHMKTMDGGLVPDFTCDSLLEDLPFGIVVLKSLAEVVDVKTPHLDTLIEWCQTKMAKEYIVNGELKGKDIKTARCPQQLGFQTLVAIVDCQKDESS